MGAAIPRPIGIYTGTRRCMPAQTGPQDSHPNAAGRERSRRASLGGPPSHFFGAVRARLCEERRRGATRSFGALAVLGKERRGAFSPKGGKHFILHVTAGSIVPRRECMPSGGKLDPDWAGARAGDLPPFEFTARLGRFGSPFDTRTAHLCWIEGAPFDTGTVHLCWIEGAPFDCAYRPI